MIPQAELHRLENGLKVILVPSRRAPVVAHAIAYGAGARDETAGHGGTAHFLEHMMFKGSAEFGAGEIDRLTQDLGGSNNAFTNHDLTLYYFSFAADRWTLALDIELDRMASVLLDPHELDSERRVILEEISMYESEPWDALDQAVHRELFPEHPYGRSVLGTRDELAQIDREVLAAFHGRLYRPENAVLSIVGDMDPQRALAEVQERFGKIPAEPGAGRASERAIDKAGHRQGSSRVERVQGELSRMLVALPSPAGSSPDHAILRLLLAVLGSGRSSRLHRALVDEGQRCVWVSTDVQETLDAGVTMIAAEALPGVEPGEIENSVRLELARLRAEPPTAEELARARRMEVADWLFGHERVNQMAFLAATACTLFDLDHPMRYMDTLLEARPEDLLRVAQLYLDPEISSVFGWSLPE